jgi:hypothetical protein
MKPKSLYPFLQHIRQEKELFTLRHNGQPPEWKDATLHQSYFDYNPELYGLLTVVDSVMQQQRDRQLFQILQSSRQGFSPEVRLTLERVTDFLVKILPPDRVLTVFLALKRVKANHKHSTKAILKYIFQHPQSVDMAICRRPAVVDCFEHAIGKNVARACAKIITEGGDKVYLQSHLLKFVENREQVKEILEILYQQTKLTGTGNYKNNHQQLSTSNETQQNQGNVGQSSRLHRHLHPCRGGSSTAMAAQPTNSLNRVVLKQAVQPCFC